MKFLENIDYQNTDKCIEQLSTYDFNSIKNNYQNSNKGQTIFHVFWNGLLNRKQLTCINSYLCTQNLKNSVLWIWLDGLNSNDIIKRNRDLINITYGTIVNIQIKLYDSSAEADETLFENYKHLNNSTNLKFRSDIARIIILYKYGGLYFDLDMILLKDMSPLLHLEFCYSWSYLNKGNNGLLRLFKGSQNCLDLMDKYLNTVSPFGLNGQKFFLGYNQYIFDETINLFCLPSTMFDPVWLLFDKGENSKYSKLNNLDGFFKSTDENINTFFNNQIYAYHWHSRNDFNIEKNSYFEKFENLFKVKLLKK